MNFQESEAPEEMKSAAGNRPAAISKAKISFQCCPEKLETCSLWYNAANSGVGAWEKHPGNA